MTETMQKLENWLKLSKHLGNNCFQFDFGPIHCRTGGCWRPKVRVCSKNPLSFLLHSSIGDKCWNRGLSIQKKMIDRPDALLLWLTIACLRLLSRMFCFWDFRTSGACWGRMLFIGSMQNLIFHYPLPSSFWVRPALLENIAEVLLPVEIIRAEISKLMFFSF